MVFFTSHYIIIIIYKFYIFFTGLVTQIPFSLFVSFSENKIYINLSLGSMVQ